MTARRHPWTPLVWVLVSLAWLGCGESRAPYVGTYRSELPYGGQGHVELVLKENGDGTWTLQHTSLRFKWKVEKGQIWLYTREGGIIIATPSEGGRRLNLDMSGTWHPSCPVEHCIIFTRVSGGGG
ncbi:MAG: hypothetical protein K6T55_05545 [Syntrophobacterales bacterium]|jgi:hypothetical protein|nr:hypothetical protein [Syntrophobacterales bacterium]